MPRLREDRCYRANPDGYPSDGAMEAAGRDEIVLAGCMVGEADPIYYCRRCLIAFEYERQFS